MTLQDRMTRYLAIAAIGLSLLVPAITRIDTLSFLSLPMGQCEGGSSGNGSGC